MPAVRPALAALLCVVLAACGGERTAEIETRVAAVPAGIVVPPDFGEADPTNWNGPGPAGYRVHGVDVSKFQGTVDWRSLRAAGTNFAFIKATEGGDRVDDRFAENWAGAAAAGIDRGAYHFYYFCSTPEIQAENFIAAVPRESGAMPPVLDLEWNPFSPTCTYRPPPEDVRRVVSRWIEIVTRHYGQPPIIYTTPDFYARNDIGSLGAEMWLRAVAETPDVVYPGQPWTFWQYSGTGRGAGVIGNLDLNVFAGSPAAWQRWRAARLN